MTVRFDPLFVRETKAARMMDMSTSEFLGLVDQGALPGPVDLPGSKRWRIADLKAVGDGSAMENGDFEA